MLNSYLLKEFALLQCYDNELVFKTIQHALVKMVEEMKLVSVIFRQLAYGLRNRIICREKDVHGNIGGVGEYSTFFRKLNGDFSTHSTKADNGCSNNQNDEHNTVILGPRTITRKGLMNIICRVREATDSALVEAFEACSIYEPLSL